MSVEDEIAKIIVNRVAVESVVDCLFSVRITDEYLRDVGLTLSQIDRIKKDIVKPCVASLLGRL